jgi:Phage integrase, N-terminal SAM-like domain
VESQLYRYAAFRELRGMVLNSVASEHAKHNYSKALDEVYALCEERKQPLSRALLMEYRAAKLEKRLSASTVNVRLSAIRKLIGEAQRNGMIGAEEAPNLAGYPTSPRREPGGATGSRGTRPRNSSQSLTAPKSKAQPRTLVGKDTFWETKSDIPSISDYPKCRS